MNSPELGAMKRDSTALRQRAEQLLRARPADVPTLPTAEVQSLVHELSVHQMELEIQNNELREAQLELAKSRDRCSDLYDLAPVGYLIFDREGVVLESNLTAAKMLGIDRESLVGASITKWIHSDSQDDFCLHRQAALAGNARQICEVQLLPANGEALFARMECVLVDSDDGPQCRTAMIDITGQKKAARAIRDMNEALSRRVTIQSDELKKISVALSHLDEGVFVTTDHHDWGNSQIVYANAAMCRITGHTADEMRKESPSLLFGEMTDKTTVRQIQEDLAAERSHLCELIAYRKDGSPFIAEVFVRPMFAVEGAYSNFIAIFRDVSEKKRIEHQLRHEIEFNENIINKSPNIILLLDTQGQILRFNPAFEKLTGWSQDEARKRDWFETFIPVRHREQIRELFQTAVDGDRTMAYVNPIITKVGEEREIEWYDAPLTNLGGELIGLLCTGQDITERKLALAAVHESEERMRAILETAADAVITIDQKGIIDNVNPATERMFGYSADELVGNNVSILMPSPYAEEHDSYLGRYLKTGEKRIIGIGREVAGKRKDGSTFPIDLAVSQVNHIGLFTGIIRDISERKETERKLLESERLAAIGEAMAGLAHESRNALQRGQACLDLLLAQLEGQSESMELVRSIQRANDDLFRLYEEVRAFAAPIRIRPKNNDARSTARQAWSDLAAIRMNRDVRLEETAGTEDLRAEFDEFAMHQVFRNILENAIQACSDPVVIQIGFQELKSESQTALSVTILDNGPGLSLEQMERIFDAFYTTRTDGTGLGLAISRRIVQAHGGTLEVNSGSGSGAEFVITLPRKQQQSTHRGQ